MYFEVKLLQNIENGIKEHYYQYLLLDNLECKLTTYRESIKLGRQRKFRTEKYYNAYMRRDNNIKLEDIPFFDKTSLEREILFQIKQIIKFKYGS